MELLVSTIELCKELLNYVWEPHIEELLRQVISNLEHLFDPSEPRKTLPTYSKVRTEEEVRAKLRMAQKKEKERNDPWDVMMTEHISTLLWFLGKVDETITKPE